MSKIDYYYPSFMNDEAEASKCYIISILKTMKLSMKWEGQIINYYQSRHVVMSGVV